MLKNLLRGDRAGKERASAPDASGIDWCLDGFDIDGSVVKVRGWLFDPANRDAEDRVLVLDEAGSVLVESPVIPVGRPDIALHEQTLDAIWSGFEAFFLVQSPRPLYVFLAHGDDELRAVGTVLANDDGPYAYVRPLSKEEAERIVQNGSACEGDAGPDGAPNDGAPAAATERPPAPSDIPSPALAACLADATRPAIVAITHSLGGGAEHYLEKRAATERERGRRFFVARFDEEAGDFTCETWLDGTCELMHVPDIETLLASVAGIASVWVNEVVGYPNVASLLRFVARFAQSRGIALEFLVHDYFSICQSYNLIDIDGVFCDLPPYERCHQCFSCLRRDDFAHAGVSEYREAWEAFLLSCDAITVFCDDSRSLLERAYPALAARGTIAVVPHEVSPLRRVAAPPDDGVVTIGVIGVLSHNKGLDVVRDIVTIIDQNDTGAELVLVGESTEDIPAITRRQTGRYQREELPDIIERERIDVVLVSSICPETFSFTASEAMDAGLPVAAFDIGAPAERVRRYDKGLILEVGTSPADIIDALRTLTASCS